MDIIGQKHERVRYQGDYWGAFFRDCQSRVMPLAFLPADEIQGNGYRLQYGQQQEPPRPIALEQYVPCAKLDAHIESTMRAVIEIAFAAAALADIVKHHRMRALVEATAEGGFQAQANLIVFVHP